MAALRKSSPTIGRVAFTAALLALVAVPVASSSTAGLDRTVVRRPPVAMVRGQYVPGHVLVGFRAGISRAAAARVHGRSALRVIRGFGGFRMQLLRVPQGVSVPAAVRSLSKNPAVAWAEPDYIRRPLLNNPPTDALFGDEWDMNNTGQLHAVSDFPGGGPAVDEAGTADADIDAPGAWGVAEGVNTTVIAVIDTGVDLSHPDLTGQKWLNPDDPPGGGDDDGNGKLDDNFGWNFADENNTLLSSNHWTGWDHGTHVAGTIAADHNDVTGVVGVCPGCRIMTLRVARESDGVISISDEVAALAYAKSKGVEIANISLGGPDWSNAEREAIRKSGILVVAAAGNDSLDNDMALVESDQFGNPVAFSPFYPAAYSLSNILTVAATNHKDEYAYSTECFSQGHTKPECAFTDWGHDSVDVAAPGVDITSTVPGGGWETWDGTSMAAPHVTGIAGLLLSQNPLMTVAQLKNAIMHGVDKPSTLHTMYIAPLGKKKTGSFTRTSGRVNAFNALSASTANATPVTDGNIDHAVSWSSAKKSGSVAWPADVNDVFKRKLSQGHTYKFTLVVPAGKDYDLWAWKPGTKEIWEFQKLQKRSAHGNGVDEVVQFTAGKTGTYYLQVSAWLFESGSYTLHFERVS